MDVGLFSKCLKGLLRHNDEVVVPGLGTFTAQIVPAGVDEDGTATPPFRKISYSQAEKPDDGLFLRWLAKDLPEGSDAALELQEFLLDLSGELDSSRAVDLGDLGQMRSSARKMYYFVSNPGLFEYPDVAGQESIATILPEEYFDEDSKPIELTGEKILGNWDEDNDKDGETDEEEPAEEPEDDAPAEEVIILGDEEDEPEEEPEEEEEPENPRNRLIGNILLILFVVLVFIMIAVTLLKDLPWMSNLLDHLLYTKEELEILGK